MFFEVGDRCGLWRLVQKKTNATNGTFRGLKGHESIAQASAWVYISSETALKGRQKLSRCPWDKIRETPSWVKLAIRLRDNM